MIEELKKFNPEAEVLMHMYGGEPVLFVLARANDNNNVWLETDSDCDLGWTPDYRRLLSRLSLRFPSPVARDGRNSWRSKTSRSRNRRRSPAG